MEEKQRKKKEREVKKIAREEEKKCKTLEREAKKAEAEKNIKNKGATMKRPVRSSVMLLILSGKRFVKMNVTKWDFNIEKYQRVSVLYVLVIGKRMMQING